MTDYTPTTKEVRAVWHCDHVNDGELGQFDRWLAGHERKIAAGALREAADEMEGELGTSGPGNRSTGYGLAGLGLLAQLRARADRIEQGGDQ